MTPSAATTRRSAAVALALLLPAPTIGVLFGMFLLPDSHLGLVLFGASKVWILALPFLWQLIVNKARPSLSPARNGGFGISALLGIGISLFILAAYALLRHQLIDTNAFREALVEIGLADPKRYIIGAAYWITINAVLEEYVWRWFVVQEFRQITSARVAIVLSALAFTVHHIFAMSVYFNWHVVAMAATGIFIGGAIWSWCYVRFKSIWPGYISHAIVDFAVFAIGWHILFG